MLLSGNTKKSFYDSTAKNDGVGITKTDLEMSLQKLKAEEIEKV
jgi:hypothetical protein